MQQFQTMTTITIPEKFRGPPRSGNGGYVGGAFAALLERSPATPIEVTLKAPIPLDTQLDVRNDEGLLLVEAGETRIAEVVERDYALEVPTPPDWRSALDVQPRSMSLMPREDSPNGDLRGFHPHCFCCGDHHEDGLRVFAAPVDDQQVAAAWQTQAGWGDESGDLPLPYLWTALDCPGQVAWAARGIRTGLLGRITARVYRSAPAGENYVVTAWPIEVDGRKHFSGSAIFDANNNIIATALSIWIGRRND